MRTNVVPVPFPASAPTNGNPVHVANWTSLTLQITNAGTGVTMVVEGTCQDDEEKNISPPVPPTGATWSAITNWATADGTVLIDILQNIAWLRIRTTAFGSGTPAAVLRYTAQ